MNNSLWKNDIDKNNVNDFLLDLKELFDKSVKYINKKIILITNKLNEIRYDDYKDTLNECVYFEGEYSRQYEILFF